MTLLKTKLPFLFSPRFWGIVLTGLFTYLQAHGTFADPELGAALTQTTGAATIVGIIGWFVKKWKA